MTTTPTTTDWEHETGLLWTCHALDRYDERTPPEAPAPERAFEAGEDVDRADLLAGSVDRSLDSARVYRRPAWGVAFLVLYPSIVTTLRIDALENPAAREHLAAYGPHPEVCG